LATDGSNLRLPRIFGRPTAQRRLLIELAVVCGSPVLILAVILAMQIRSDIREDTTVNAVRAAKTAVADPLGAEFASGSPPRPVMEQNEQRALDEFVQRARKSVAVDRVIVRDEAGRIVFSDDHRLIGKRVGSTKDLKLALSGRTVYHPLTKAERPPFAPTTPAIVVWSAPNGASEETPKAAIELWIPTAPIEATVSDRVGAVYTALAGVMIVLWIALIYAADRATGRLLKLFHSREEQALSDPLTGLPNRTKFQDDLVGCMTGGRKPSGTVILMDLDRFKDVNDTLGHHNGDLLLERVASRLKTVASAGATVARLGGDEFAILLPGLHDRQEVTPIARTILKVLEEPVVVGGLALQVEGSLGIAMFPENGNTPDAILRAADVAMYIAKEQRSGHEFYDPALHEHRHDAGRLALIGELRRAMDEAELVLHYQPKIDVRTGAASGFEALARWYHPERGLLSPDEFIPLAERSNLLRQVTLYLIDSALRQCSEWHEKGYRVSVAVNLSMQNLLDLRLPTDVGQLLESWRLPKGSLELEVTESTIMADHRRAQTILARLSKMGVRISIDDFGTGYSSLAYLQDLAVSAIKIDKSFVMTMDTDASKATIVESTIELGHNLDLKVVAEGVESIEAYERLAELGCDYAQGFFLSRPLSPDRAAIWLDAFGTPATGMPATSAMVPDLGGDPQPA
jgi:diguanylate cyclase (GGDEF)-like protein